MKNPTTPNDFRHIRRTLHAAGPEFRDRMRATFEDAGVTRQQWRILNAIEDGPTTAESIDESAERRHRGRGKDAAAATPEASAPLDLADPTDGPDDLGHSGHPFAGAPGRFGRRGFGPGFGPFGRGFGRGFGPGFGPAFGAGFGHGHGFGPHGGQHGRRRPAAEVLAGLAERGLVQRTDTSTDTSTDAASAGSEWMLTETGVAELARIRTKVTAMKASLRDGISTEDWDTAMSVLQRVAENSRR